MQELKDNIIDFIEDHTKLCVIIGIVVVLIIAMFGIRSHNLKKKEAEAFAQAQQAEIEASLQAQLEQDTEEEKVPEKTYKESLGLDANDDSDGRVEIIEDEPQTYVEPEPVQIRSRYPTSVTIFDNTSVPKRNQDGTSCKAFYNSVTLKDFSSMWGTSLTEEDFTGGNFYMVGVEQNPDDALLGDLQSTGWLIDNLDKMNDNDAIKFTNLHVIGSLSSSHVALLCSYDWYSAFGMTDTLVVFEDISNSLNVNDFKDGDIFSATVYRHNIKIEPNVKGYRVIVVQYTPFE